MTVIAWLSSVLGTVQGILVRVSVILTSFYLFVYDCAGCYMHVGFALAVASRGYSLVMVCRLLAVLAPLVEHWL